MSSYFRILFCIVQALVVEGKDRLKTETCLKNAKKKEHLRAFTHNKFSRKLNMNIHKASIQPIHNKEVKKKEHKRMLAYDWRHKAGRPANRSGWNYVIIWKKESRLRVRWTSIQDIPKQKHTQRALIPLPTQHTSISHLFPCQIKTYVDHHRTEWQQ